MALAAMIAVLHDVIITVGVYSVFGWEVTPATVIAFLTILGFSLYDTVVVFDRMKDGMHRYGRTGQYTYTMIARRTLNQSLMRCINTSVTTLLPIFSMLIVGGYLLDQPLLVDFSRALHHRPGARACTPRCSSPRRSRSPSRSASSAGRRSAPAWSTRAST